MISSRDLKHNITEEKIKQDEQTNPSALSREPSPNRGASVPDFQAIGPDSEDKSEWLKRKGIDVSKQVKFSKLSHMRYQHPDLQEITTFLRDFGMHVVKKTDTQRWFAGYGPDQYVYYAQQGPKKFLGGAFEVQSHADLEKALKVPGAKVLSDGIEKLEDAPGGGHIVILEDPEGFRLNLVYGQEPVSRPQGAKPKGKIVFNDEIDKPRQRAFNRFQPGPAEVYKLGHFGLNVANFPAAMSWYTTHFNLIPSDILYIPTPPFSSSSSSSTSTSSPPSPTSISTAPDPTPTRTPVALFAHINLSQTLTDHHTMFLTSLPPSPSLSTSTLDTVPPQPHVHHSSFEVHDLDTQFLGHQYLAQKSYKSVWGVGRHILGSQIFDYWWDTTGFMIEHYADGDLVNVETPMGYGPAGHEGLAVWGPEVPGEFLD